MTRRILSLALALALLLALGPAISTASAAAKQPYTYVAFGDSIASGFALAQAAQSYPNRLAGLVGAGAVKNYSESGMKSDGLLKLLQDSKLASALTKAQPDLITVSIGAGDLLTVFLERVCEAAGVDMKQPDYAEQIALALNNPDNLNAVIVALSDSKTISELNATIDDAKANIALIAARLRALCPKAKIVFTNAYNPFLGESLRAGGYDVNELAELMLGRLNDAFTKAASADGNIAVADVKTAFKLAYAQGVNCTNVSLAKSSLDPHPSAVGHQAIADAIYAKVKPGLPKTPKPAMVGRLTQSAKVYKSEGKTALLSMAKNSGVVVYSWNEQYAKIAYKTGYAYVKLSALELKPLASQSYKLAYPTRNAPVYTTTKANKKLAGAYKNGTLLVLCKSGVWAKVQIGGKTGYIRNAYLKYVK